MSRQNEIVIAARRAKLEAAMDAEVYGVYKRVNASRARVGSNILRAEGVMGKRTIVAKARYGRTAPATVRARDIWENRRVA